MPEDTDFPLADSEITRVLILEDSEPDFHKTRDMLTEVYGRFFKADWVSTYSAAKIALATKQYDACLVDNRLSRQNGDNLMEEASRNGWKVPLIVMTGNEHQPIDTQLLRAGAADYLHKPRLTSYDLERSIRYAVQQKSYPPSAPINGRATKAIPIGAVITIVALCVGAAVWASKAHSDLREYVVEKDHFATEEAKKDVEDKYVQQKVYNKDITEIKGALKSQKSKVDNTSDKVNKIHEILLHSRRIKVRRPTAINHSVDP
jgi:CheY-like chemotaxis protein